MLTKLNAPSIMLNIIKENEEQKSFTNYKHNILIILIILTIIQWYYSRNNFCMLFHKEGLKNLVVVRGEMRGSKRETDG